MPGCGSHAYAAEVRTSVDQLVAKGYSVVVFGYRGFGKDSKGNDLKLVTPRTYSSGAFEDFIEPANYLHQKYC